MSSAANALRDADEAIKAVDPSTTWEGAVTRIKWVMDTVSAAAEVRHGAMPFKFILD